MKLFKFCAVTGSTVAMALALGSGCTVEDDPDDGTGLGGSSTGGAATGGADNGGADTGGADTGGANTGGAAGEGTGGGDVGGSGPGGSAGAATGGAATGGTTTGGTETGGTTTGGTTTGGTTTGGTTTGGATTGGTTTGGTETGGATTGGVDAGGAAGAPAGGAGGAGGEGGATCITGSTLLEGGAFDCEGWADTQFGTTTCTIDTAPLGMEACEYFATFANQPALEELLICMAGYGFSNLDCNATHDAFMNDCLTTTRLQLCAVPTASADCATWAGTCDEVNTDDCEEALVFSAKTATEIDACFSTAGDSGVGCGDNLYGCY